MLDDLQSSETQKIFAHHRNLKFLIGEIIACILLAGVGYIIGASIMKHKTGHFGLFAEPRSQKMVNEASKYILSMR